MWSFAVLAFLLTLWTGYFTTLAGYNLFLVAGWLFYKQLSWAKVYWLTLFACVALGCYLLAGEPFCPMQNHKALCSPDGALALNPSAIESGAEEQAILLHEEGHFATGAFYTVQSPYTIRQKQENIANRYIYKRYFPPQRLQAAMAAGLREPWQLAEYFDLPEAMIREMLDYYQAQGLLELCPEEEL